MLFVIVSDAKLTPDLDLDGLTPDEAFAVLGNDIRLDIVRVLWQADAAHRFGEVSDTAKSTGRYVGAAMLDHVREEASIRVRSLRHSQGSAPPLGCPER